MASLLKYKKSFQTELEYVSFKATKDFLEPNVSLVHDTSVIHYNKETKDIEEYLSFTNNGNGGIASISLNSHHLKVNNDTVDIQYSYDKLTWYEMPVDNEEPVTLDIGDRIYVKGQNPEGFIVFSDGGSPEEDATNTSLFVITTDDEFSGVEVHGNIMSIIYKDDFINNNIIPYSWCFTAIFLLCTAIETAPALPATTLTYSCYYKMFYGCTSLTIAPELPATTLTRSCYNSMFSGCAKLTTAPELPATTLADSCYSGMFHSCTKLTTAPELPATTLADYCYNSMFYGCAKLTTAPELPATILTDSCYGYMFSDCISLTTAPELPATTLAEYCYSNMFTFCYKLIEAPELPATTLANSCYSLMFRGCINLNASPELPATTLADSCYFWMFGNTEAIPDCTNIDFTSSAVVASGGLKGLFYGTNITDALLEDILPINNQTGKYCLPVTTLTRSCYNSMFSGCTKLTTAPELPATTLADYCYLYMFSGCSSLTEAPELPATTLTDYCYGYMFRGCTKLNYIKAMFITTPSNNYTVEWVRGVSSTGTFVKNSAATWDVTGYFGVPSGWTVQTASA